MAKGLKIMAIEKPSKTRELVREGPGGPEYYNTIRFIEVIKHFPWHNADKTVWVDEEFGAELPGFERMAPQDIIKLTEGDVANWPDVVQIVRIPGKSFFRDVAVADTVANANQIRGLIMQLDKLGEIVSDNRYYEDVL